VASVLLCRIPYQTLRVRRHEYHTFKHSLLMYDDLATALDPHLNILKKSQHCGPQDGDHSQLSPLNFFSEQRTGIVRCSIQVRAFSQLFAVFV
jgi:hypothetical protein